MERSLDDYISHQPNLQVAIKDSKRFRRRFQGPKNTNTQNSEELTVVSRQYICTDMDTPENHAVGNQGSAESGCFQKCPGFEEAYLSLDLQNQDEFDKLYEAFNNNKTQKPTLNPGTVSIEGITNKMSNPFKTPRLEQNQMNQMAFQAPPYSQQWRPNAPYGNSKCSTNLPAFQPYFNNYNTNNRHNHNGPYQNSLVVNGQFGNVNVPSNNQNTLFGNNTMQLCHNQNNSNNTGLFSAGCNLDPFSLNVALMNALQNNPFNMNAIGGNCYNMASGSNQLSKSMPFNSMNFNNAVAVNVPQSLEDNTNRNLGNHVQSNGSKRRNFRRNKASKGSLNNVAGAKFTHDSNSFDEETQKKVLKILNAIGTGNKRNGNSANNSDQNIISQRSVNSTEEMYNDRSVASVLGLTPEDLNINSVPVILFLMEHIFENGIQLPSNGINQMQYSNSNLNA